MKTRLFNIKPTDIDFVMRSFVYALLILALLHAFQPYWGESVAEPPRNEVEELARKTQFVTATDVGRYLQNTTKPTMLLVYASWCGYCRKELPGIYQLWSEGKIDGGQMIVLSIDTKTTPLAEYLLSNKYNTMVGMPMILARDKENPLHEELQKLGSRYEGGIPYVGFFAPGGKLLDEIPGYVEKAQIEYALGNLK